MKYNFLLLIVISLFTKTGFSQEQGKGNRDIQHSADQERLEAMLDRKTFVFHARRALPARGSSIDLTTNQSFIKFSPDLIESYMPFFGRAYSGIGYGGDSGFHFKGQPEEFTINKKRGTYLVNASVRGENDNFRLSLSAKPGGTARLTIMSNNRETISYTGEIREEMK